MIVILGIMLQYFKFLTTRKTIGVFKCYYVLCVYHYFIMYAAC